VIDHERRRREGPVITVPTITLEGDANGAPHPDPNAYAKKFCRRRDRSRQVCGAFTMNANQVVLAAVLAATTGSSMPTSIQPPVEGELASLGSATEWINSPPLSPANLRGKVVLIDFWTYTCINWLRTLPYVRAWAE
jgi:hypothetical protein